jgi:uncharacterized protein (DUF488 family)
MENNMGLQDKSSQTNITIFSIGSSEKSAEEFFTKLQNAGVIHVEDIRLKNTSNLAGFAKKDNLEYFLKVIADISYTHRPEFAPTEEILDSYKKKKTISWSEFKQQFSSLINERRIEKLIMPEAMNKACLLCSEPTAEKCHRRLVAEYLRDKWGNVEIRHLL